MRLDRLSLTERIARAEARMLAEHATQGIDPDAADPVGVAATARILATDPRPEMEQAS